MGSDSTGWIKLYRKLKDEELWLEEKPFTKGQAWVDLLLMAQCVENTGYSSGKAVKFEPGKVYASIQYLGERWGWSKKRTINFLKSLESGGKIGRNSEPKKGTVITLVNWAKYQSRGRKEEPLEEPLEEPIGYRKGYRMGSHTKRREEEKEEKEEKKNIFYSPYTYDRRGAGAQNGTYPPDATGEREESEEERRYREWRYQ